MTLPLGQLTARTQCTEESTRTGARFQPFSTRRLCKFLNTSGLPDRGATGRLTPERQSSWTVTEVMATGASGRSRALRGADTIASTTDIPFVTIPKIV